MGMIKDGIKLTIEHSINSDKEQFWYFVSAIAWSVFYFLTHKQ